MFRRQKPVSWKNKIKSWFWPSIGWRRYFRYLICKLSRLGGTPYEIAAGTACGIAISFTPFVGFHFLLAAITAWFVRGNILAGAIGTAAGNPWTFPFIWTSVLRTGQWILGQNGSLNIRFTDIFEKAMSAIFSLDFSEFAGEVWTVIMPMMVGCIPYYIVVWGVSFGLLKKSLEKISQRRIKIKVFNGI